MRAFFLKIALISQPAPPGMVYNPITGVNEYDYAVTTTGGMVRKPLNLGYYLLWYNTP